MNTAETVANASHHLQPLISDLGLILMTAAVAVLLFKKIKQPLVLGYLIAGFLAGNHFDFFPSVKDIKSVEVWAEIGVIFLLFSLGLEFSFKKLMKVGGTASITAVTQIIAMVAIGYLVGQWIGWKPMDSIFLGVILSISSTTIILKTFDELGVKTQKFAGIVIGSLIVQDIIAILMMVLLSTIAVSQQFSGGELLQSVFKLIFFLTIWFVGGIFFIPTLLKKAKSLLTDEMLLIISLALCLMMVILAANVGFSPALGAFIMGSIIAETTQAEHIEHLVKPVKDLFGAVFFVSVGMLINPDTLSKYALPVAILTFVVIIGQSISSTIGALLSGQPLKQSVQTGMSLSQIGEFSFIIATLGMTLNVTSDFLYPIVVAVSAVTTFTTPFMVKFATPFSEYLEKKLPRKWTKKIERYSANAQSIKSVSNWQIVVRAFLTQVIIHSVIIVAIILISSKFILPLVKGSQFGNTFGALITLIIISPFLWALSLRRVAVKEVAILREERKYRGPVLMMILLRMLLTLFYIGFLLNIFFSPIIAFIALIAAVVVYFVFPKKLNAQYHKIENHFLENLNAREIIKAKRSRSHLTPWDGHMTTFDIAATSNIAGKTLDELRIREKMGINIAFIKRGEIMINIPNKNERLFPGDEICVIGTDNQVKEFKSYLHQNEIEIPEKATETDIILKQLELDEEEFIGKNIKDSQLREKTKGLIVGIERKGNRILNPESSLILEKNDILWVVGSKKLLTTFFKN
ncbi:cation:proton antiporter domain-containing protein [Flavobacterium gawalongense]|uniref:Sodium:proton antiporter n=1 Tax=Flavobacterium gawalongense TaxID=2594432 RepID=A0A553BN67_9FLAO|nr:cation:proton antiporter [Flavobacterium gawalongense]TRX00162.1 sodium:proton antiporter [Flavobacterium gawalongense]TRX04910.1 sodium:proton antiporter [Flavobacterium gawalongense]TRX09688.1 sodium:proton antiporter [Flavobacterium gawalongense]TRX10828.1 sodium:proton antiporter [Flavobacterium gawalongense]TRX28093.1 sodium:proton antiporter [Flavobacterium gawalongense]